MSEIVKVVLDCSNAGVPDVTLADDLRADALRLIDNGEVEKAAALVTQAKEVLEQSKLATEQTVALTDEELAQHHEDAAAVAAAQEQADTEAADRAALVDKLAAGKASGAEVQQALAQLLG